MSINNDNGIYWNGETGPQGPQGAAIINDINLWGQSQVRNFALTTSFKDVFSKSLPTQRATYLMNAVVSISANTKFYLRVKLECVVNGNPKSFIIFDNEPSNTSDLFRDLSLVQRTALFKTFSTEDDCRLIAQIKGESDITCIVFANTVPDYSQDYSRLIQLSD